jgi:lysophospholipase L1-like esterase
MSTVQDVLKGKTILFQGDSVTDSGRDRTDPTDLGDGYVLRAAAVYWALLPASDARFINRAVSGNRTRDLLERYDEDFTAVKPDFISILIGINDVWRAFDANDPTSLEQFHRNYETLLRQLRRDVPKARLLLMEPFLMPVLPEHAAWRPDLDPKLQSIRALALEYGAALLPLDGLLAAYTAGTAGTTGIAGTAGGFSPADIAEDGVHPTETGQGLIAFEWLKKVGVFG